MISFVLSPHEQYAAYNKCISTYPGLLTGSGGGGGGDPWMFIGKRVDGRSRLNLVYGSVTRPPLAHDNHLMIIRYKEGLATWWLP
jgi:hypothetical protein